MNKDELMDLELNTIVSYGIFGAVKFKGKDEKYVHMQDSFGASKKVYIDLFLKHSRIVNRIPMNGE